ncbi:MAG TPA: glycosyltransferase [Devosiaceae bacterium]|jgi:glycosyltransferase involved in cell wall biosynthesis|nr:glycosyltransferase [Devosiaceae bacterium]
MKKFTIGITTHNEALTIGEQLDRLTTLPPEVVDIIVFDDGSTDGTPDVIIQHPISTQPNFRAHLSKINHGTPSVGRTYFGEHAHSEYVVLFDGDDILDVDHFLRFAEVAPTGQDLILSSYQYQGRTISLPGEGGPFDVNAITVSRVLAGVGGKAYKTALLREFGPDPVRGRSDDVRMNMRIIAASPRKLWHVAGPCFYRIREARKSVRAASINWHEVETRAARFEALRTMYPIDATYLVSLRNQLLRVVREDETLEQSEKGECIRRIVFIFAPYVEHPRHLPREVLKAVERSGLQIDEVFPNYSLVVERHAPKLPTIWRRAVVSRLPISFRRRVKVLLRRLQHLLETYRK